VDAKNSGGNISVGQAEDGVSARTSSGSISIKSAKGKLSLTDAGGNIEVGGASGAIEARTSSGVIVAVFAAQPTEDCRLEVSGGGITVTAPKSAGFNLEANSSGGRVKSELPVVMTLQSEPRFGVLQGKINSGGPALVLRASSGDIEIKASNAPVSQIKVEDEEK
jgi:DUF4097 and DUF4098 domain-containing protein YvlB